jgi:hypothetical protein
MGIVKKKWADMTPEERAITAQEERRGYAGIARGAESGKTSPAATRAKGSNWFSRMWEERKRRKQAAQARAGG